MQAFGDKLDVEGGAERRDIRFMASRKTLIAANLQALGTAQLAELLIEISKGNAAAQRRLRLALAGNAGANEAARAVGKQLASIARSRVWLDWQKIKLFVVELDAQRRAILELIAPSDPREAFELMWRLVSCSEPVFTRSDDGSGRLSAAFHTAMQDLGPLAQRAGMDPEDLAARAERVFRADGHGTWDELVSILAPRLGTTGLTTLKALMQAWQAEPAVKLPARERRVIGWSSSGPIHADDIQAHHRQHISASVLQQVADALGDVDGFIAQIDKRARRMPAVAATIARRLLNAGRAQEAWAALEAVEAGQRDQAPAEWEEVRVDVLEKLGRPEEGQAFRWGCFLATLNAGHLRAFLKKLPDFDDFEAEQRALDHALAFGDVHQALAFLITWPDLQRASQLVLERTRLLNGDLYEVLSPAADALDGKYPLAAILLRRSMISFTLQSARSTRYSYAARYLDACRAAAARVDDLKSAPDQPAFEQALRAAHGRKATFWQEVDALKSS